MCFYLMCLCFFLIVVHSMMSFSYLLINSHRDGWPRTAFAAEGADYQCSLEAPADQIKYKKPHSSVTRVPFSFSNGNSSLQPKRCIEAVAQGSLAATKLNGWRRICNDTWK